MQKPHNYEARQDQERDPKVIDLDIVPADAPGENSGDDEERPPDVVVEN